MRSRLLEISLIILHFVRKFVEREELVTPTFTPGLLRIYSFLEPDLGFLGPFLSSGLISTFPWFCCWILRSVLSFPSLLWFQASFWAFFGSRPSSDIATCLFSNVWCTDLKRTLYGPLLNKGFCGLRTSLDFLNSFVLGVLTWSSVLWCAFGWWASLCAELDTLFVASF